MPGGDKRGPRGQGPMTGRGAGYCAGFDGPGFMAGDAPRGEGYGWGRGFGGRGRGRGGPGFGQGRGWGFHRGPRPAVDVPYVASPAGDGYTMGEELALLREQLKALEDRIAQIKDDE